MDLIRQFGQLFGEVVNFLYQLVAIKSELRRRLLPVVNADIVDEIFSAEFHSKFGFMKSLIGVRQIARQIVERGEPDISPSADKDTVVLGMSVCTGNEPIEGERFSEGPHIGSWRSRVVSEYGDNINCTGTTVVLRFLGGWKSKRLAHVFLMHTVPDTINLDAIIPIEHNGELVFEPEDLRIWDSETKRAPELKAIMLVLGVTFEFAGGWFEDTRRRYTSRGNAPSTVFKKESRFWLCSSKTELSFIARKAPRGIIAVKNAQ